MIIERTAGEFVIRIPITAQVEQIQDMIDYLRYKELTSTYEVGQSEVDMLAREINKGYKNVITTPELSKLLEEKEIKSPPYY